VAETAESCIHCGGSLEAAKRTRRIQVRAEAAQAERAAADKKQRQQDEADKKAFSELRAEARSGPDEPTGLFKYLLEQWDQADWEKNRDNADPEDLDASPESMKDALLGQSATGTHGFMHVVGPAWLLMLFLLLFFDFWMSVGLAIASIPIAVGYSFAVDPEYGIRSGLITAVVGLILVGMLHSCFQSAGESASGCSPSSSGSSEISCFESCVSECTDISKNGRCAEMSAAYSEPERTRNCEGLCRQSGSCHCR
tara:strand:- start:1250 stop:2011 length:762 start_codon:yes stop_codon:yes gene_type:complete